MLFRSTQSASPHPLIPIGSVSSMDAGIVTLHRPWDASTFVLSKQSQSGAYEKVQAFNLDIDCSMSPQTLSRDHASGFIVAGLCRSQPALWLAHVDSTLELSEVLLVTDSDPDAIKLIPTVAVRLESETVIAGSRVLRNRPSGEGTRYQIGRAHV